MTKDSSDQELIDRCLINKGHSFIAFKILVERYEGLVFRVARRYVLTAELAEEITQETFLKAYNQLHKLEKKHMFKAWLLTIAKNLSLDHLRAQAKLPTTDLPDNIENYSQPTNQENESLDEIIYHLQNLNTEDQDILSLHYLGEMSIKDLSIELGIGESAVKMRLMRAREKLEKMMAKK